jgi:multidrug efflux system outer membrane protein
MAAVVASTASLYFQILELDNELAIARANLAVRRQSLDLVRARLYGGVGTLQDVRQAEQLVAQAQAAIPQIQRATAQAENALSVLLGGYPAPVPRGLPLRAQVAMPLVPAAGLPSELLERRPDIRASEESLIAANAQIGVARSLLFPQITLQAAAGAGTVQTAYLSLGQGYISILPQLVQQIFNAGAARAAVGQAQAAKEAAVLSYIQSVHQGFSDVSDALVDYDKDREITVASAENEFASLDSARLANLRFEGGVTSYLEVLDSQTRAFSAEVQLSQAELSERLDIVDLYQALGGGWQPETAAVTTPAPVQPPNSSPVPSP